MNHTTNLHLPQWEETDRIQMDDFNDAMEKIDAAIPHIATGTYTGTGEYGEEHPNTLTFDFAPKALLVLPQSNGWVTTAQLLAIKDVTCVRNTFDGGSNAEYHTNLTWSGNTVSWYSASADGQFNYNGKIYYYCAIG